MLDDMICFFIEILIFLVIITPALILAFGVKIAFLVVIGPFIVSILLLKDTTAYEQEDLDRITKNDQ